MKNSISIKINFKKLFIGFGLCILFINAPAQNRSKFQDSLQIAYSKASDFTTKQNIIFYLGRENWFIRNLPEAKKYLQSYVLNTKQATNENYVVPAYNFLANLYLTESDFDNALIHYNLALFHQNKITNKTELPSILETGGSIYTKLGDLKTALPLLSRADSLYKISPNENFNLNASWAEIKLGQIYMSLQNLSEAENYFTKAYNFSKNKNDNFAVMAATQDLAKCKLQQQKPYEAITILNKLLLPPYFLSDYTQTIYTYDALGDAYVQIKNYAKATEYFEKAKSLCIRNSEFIMLDAIYAKLASMAYYTKNNTVYNSYIDSAYFWNKSSKNLNTLVKITEIQMQQAIENNDYNKALSLQKTTHLLKDSMLNIKNLELINNLQILNKVRQKDEAINQLNQVVTLKNAAIQKDTYIKYLLSFLILGIIALFYFIIKNRIQIDKIKTINSVIQERERIASEMHDDIGAGLTSIKLMSELAILKKDKQVPTAELNKIKNNASNLIENMSELVWSLSPKNDTFNSFLNYIKIYATEYLGENEIQLELDIIPSTQNITINGELRRNLYLAIKETLHNTVKHAQATQVKLHITLQKQQLHISIQDNGKGIELNKIREFGNGLKNLKSRIQKFNGSYQISNNNGTLTSIEVPILSKPA